MIVWSMPEAGSSMQVYQDFHARLICESHAPKCLVDSTSGLQSQIFCAAMKRPAPAEWSTSSGDPDAQQLPIVSFQPKIKFVIKEIPLLEELEVECPDNESLDYVKEAIAQQLYSLRGVRLYRSMFCVSQFNSKISYQAPLSALNNKAALKFEWTASPEGRPRWSYAAWNPHM